MGCPLPPRGTSALDTAVFRTVLVSLPPRSTSFNAPCRTGIDVAACGLLRWPPVDEQSTSCASTVFLLADNGGRFPSPEQKWWPWLQPSVCSVRFRTGSVAHRRARCLVTHRCNGVQNGSNPIGPPPAFLRPPERCGRQGEPHPGSFAFTRMALDVALLLAGAELVAHGIGAVAGPLLAPWRARREGQARIIAATFDAKVVEIRMQAYCGYRRQWSPVP